MVGASMNSDPAHSVAPRSFIQGLGLPGATMIVVGSMVGSGIFIVSADIARLVGSAGWLLVVWLVTAGLTLLGALAYGELAAMKPDAGGQYVFLREAYGPLWGFLYGWTAFLVIQTGTIAAVAVAFARFLGVLAPQVLPTAWLVPPVNLSRDYALSLSTQQLAAIGVIALLTFLNTRGLELGKMIQTVFTSAKLLSLVGLIVIGLFLWRRAGVLGANFADAWTPRGAEEIKPDFALLPVVSAATGIGLVVAVCVAQVGSLFSSVAWETVTFVAAEVRNPKRNIPRSLVCGTALVITLYLLVNLTYLSLLPLDQIQHAPDDRVATAALSTVFGGWGATIMAAVILVSTFGCNNGIILTGARVYYAMACDGLFFNVTGRLNARHVPAVGLVLQGIWASLLVLARTRLRDPATGAALLDPATGGQQYGNLYSNLLDYVVCATLVFYVLTVVGVFVLRRTRPDADRPFRVVGYPLLPAIYVVTASAIVLVLALYKTQTTWPGLVIVLTGVPVYALWKRWRTKAA